MAQPAEVTRVLVVDDHEMFSEALELLLGRQPDVELVGSARDADEAMAMLHQDPHVVLMDLDMPGTDGIEATREIATRDLDSNPGTTGNNYTLTHDAAGNLTDDGSSYDYVYDVPHAAAPAA